MKAYKIFVLLFFSLFFFACGNNWNDKRAGELYQKYHDNVPENIPTADLQEIRDLLIARYNDIIRLHKELDGKSPREAEKIKQQFNESHSNGLRLEYLWRADGVFKQAAQTDRDEINRLHDLADTPILNSQIK